MAITTRDGSRKGTLYLYRRVPKRYASVEPRKFVWISLHTDSLSVAKAKEGVTWEQLVAAWEAKLAGDSAEERRHAVSVAKHQVGVGGRFISEQSIQLHGGIGMTEEYALAHYAKRIAMINNQFGDADYHLDRFAADMEVPETA